MSLLRVELQISDDNFPLETTFFFAFHGSLSADLDLTLILWERSWPLIATIDRTGPHEGSVGRDFEEGLVPGLQDQPNLLFSQSFHQSLVKHCSLYLELRNGPGLKLGQSGPGNNRSPRKAS